MHIYKFEEYLENILGFFKKILVLYFKHLKT